MTTAYPETITFPQGLATAPSLSGLIDETIKRFTEEWRLLKLPGVLQFPSELETVYEAETRQMRVRELRFTVSAAAGFEFLTAATDPIFVPDIGMTGIWLRAVVFAIMIATVLSFHRVSAAIRESLVCVAAFSFIGVIAALPLFSHSALAPYVFYAAVLGFNYANTTVPMQFRFAWRFTVLGLATVILSLFLNARISLPLTIGLSSLAIVGASFSVIANYRMERSQRLGYLLASKEALRLFALNRDREELAVISKTDALTGVANRGHFDRRLTALFDGGAEKGASVYLLMLDVDFFKRYNDRYGHPAGDACLRSIAAVLSRAVRDKKDLAFRYGGEEFGALLLQTTQAQTEEVAERIRSSVQEAAIEHGNRGDTLQVVTVSIGVAHAVISDRSTAASLIERADRSLYASKNGGRNQVSFSAETEQQDLATLR